MQRSTVEDEQLINIPYYATLKTTDPSILSSISSSSHRLSEMTSTTNSSISLDPNSTTINASDFDQFDIIDSLDFDDVDDTLLGIYSRHLSNARTKERKKLSPNSRRSRNNSSTKRINHPRTLEYRKKVFGYIKYSIKFLHFAFT